MSKIEWTGITWNFLKGCNPVSKGCENCYAMRMAWRLQHNPKMAKEYEGTTRKTAGGKIQWTGKINIDEQRLLRPLSIKKSTVWFVNSMSDLFHESVPFEIIDKAFCIMKYCPQHTFQILTKRPERMLEYFSVDRPQILDDVFMMLLAAEMNLGSSACYVQSDGLFNWPQKNIWLGVSVEDQKTADERIPVLLQVPAAVRFLSCEPLLGKIDLSITSSSCSHIEPLHSHPISSPNKPFIDWVIVGGESGPGARPMHPDWARSLRDQCKSANVSFFFKQWGEYGEVNQEDYGMALWSKGILNEDIDNNRAVMKKIGKKRAGRLLDGKLYDEFPK